MLNFLASDYPHVKNPATEVCRDMSSQTVRTFLRLMKAARYLISRDEVRFKIEWHMEVRNLKVFTDSVCAVHFSWSFRLVVHIRSLNGYSMAQVACLAVGNIDALWFDWLLDLSIPMQRAWQTRWRVV